MLGTRLRHEVHPDVDPARPYMFVQNHVNLLDHCTVYNATPHFKQGVELAKHFEIPVYGWFMRHAAPSCPRDATLKTRTQPRGEHSEEVHRSRHPSFRRDEDA